MGEHNDGAHILRADAVIDRAPRAVGAVGGGRRPERQVDYRLAPAMKAHLDPEETRPSARKPASRRLGMVDYRTEDACYVCLYRYIPRQAYS